MKNLTDTISTTVEASEAYEYIQGFLGLRDKRDYEVGETLNDLWDNFRDCIMHDVVRDIRLEMRLKDLL